MKKRMNNLDERQEQTLLNIEKSGCWFAFWALLISIFVQQAIFGISEIKYVAGEWIIFMVLAVYLFGACLKNGIWDRQLKANFKTNLTVSLVASIVFGGIVAVVDYANFKSTYAAAVTFVMISIAIFVLCLLALSVTSAMYNKRVRKLEKDDESDTL